MSTTIDPKYAANPAEVKYNRSTATNSRYASSPAEVKHMDTTQLGKGF